MQRQFLLLAAAVLVGMSNGAAAAPVPVKDLGRFLGWRDSPLVGYGLVTGLAGSGDSPRNEVTRQALRNVLSRFGAQPGLDQLHSRNVAVVMVTASCPPSADVGDKINVAVTSIGDARSLVGGSLLMTPLLGADQRTYALAQGALVVGGYRFDAERNLEQRNHPTAAIIPGGAIVEAARSAELLTESGELVFLLDEPDAATARRLAEAINRSQNSQLAEVRDAKAVIIRPTGEEGDLYRLVAGIESLAIEPARWARVVVNERSGTVVTGGDVLISSVAISQGDIRVSVSVENRASQPTLLGGLAPQARSLIVSNTRLAVDESQRDAVVTFPNTTVADLMTGLVQARVSTREMIAILQAVKAAGALHADIIVQ